jgi:hypothetical protein
MAQGDERLVVALEARVRDFEKNFERAQKTANTRFTAIERRAEASAANLKAAFAGAGASIAQIFNTLGGAGIIAGGGLAGAVATLRGVAASVADLAGEAKKAGVAFEPFQELKFAAEQARVGVDALADGLKEMQLRADEFIRTGAGSSEEAFKRLGYSASTLKRKLKDPAALFEEIIDKLKGFEKAAQIRIADEIFGGTGGEQFVRFMEQGEGALGRARQRARDLGLILSDDVGKKAQEITRQFDELAARIEVALKSGVLEGAGALERYKGEIIAVAAALGALGAGVMLGPLVASLAAAAAGAVTAGAQLTRLNATILAVAGAQRVAALASAGLATALRVLGGPAGIAITALVGAIAMLALRQDQAKLAADNHREAMAELDRAIAEVRGRVPGAEAALKSLAERHVDNARKALADAEAEYEYARAVAANQKLGGWAGRHGGTMPTTNASDLAAAADAALTRVKEAQGRLSELEAKIASAPTAAPTRTADPALPGKGPTGEDAVKAAQERLSALEVERQALGMTAQAAAAYRFEQEALAQAKARDVELTPAQMAQLHELAGRYGEVTAAIEQTRASQQQMQELQRELGGLAMSSISGLIDGTKSWNDVLKDSLKLLTDLLLKAILLGEGPLGSALGGGEGGLIGTLLSGLAEGGAVKAAGGGRIRGPGTAKSDSIPALLSNGEFVVNAAQAKKFAPLLEAINAGRIPRFAAGGFVGAGAGLRTGGPVTISPTINISGGPAGMTPKDVEKVVQDGISSALTAYDRGQARRTAIEAVTDHRARTSISRLR